MVEFRVALLARVAGYLENPEFPVSPEYSRTIYIEFRNISALVWLGTDVFHVQFHILITQINIFSLLNLD